MKLLLWIKGLKISKKMRRLLAGHHLRQGQDRLPHHHSNILQNHQVPKLQLWKLERKCREGVELQQDVDQVEEQELESHLAVGFISQNP